MRSGNLKHKITIQTYSEAQNSFGEVVKGWSDYEMVYASITPLSAKEFFKAGVQAEATHKVELRYLKDVKPKMRVIYGSRVFDIESVINVREANKTLQLVCSEVV